MRLWLIRPVLVFALLIVMAWAVLYRLYTEMKGIPFFIWCDWREDIDSFVGAWRTGRFN